jgi:DNA polymerase III subunit delta
MKLSVAKANGFIEKPDTHLKIYLVYGPDSGMVRENAQKLLKQFVKDVNDPFSVCAVEGSTLAKDPARFGDEMASQSLMGGRRVVHVQDAGDEIFLQVDRYLLSDAPGDSVAILEGGELEKRSKLRGRIEDDPKCMAIPCYPEEGAALETRVRNMLQEQGFSASREALSKLSALLPPDRIGLRLEVDKLVTYALHDPHKRITAEMVDACMSDGGEQDMDEAVTAAASGEAAKLEKQMKRLQGAGAAPVALLRAAQRHMLRLYEARARMDNEGKSADEAMKSLRPPVFFKQEASFRNQLRRWSPLALERANALLLRAEAQVKSSNMPAELIAEKALRDIANR